MTPSRTKQERVDAAYAECAKVRHAAHYKLQKAKPGSLQALEIGAELNAADRALRDTLAKIERGE